MKRPACANVSGVQIFANVPPPLSTQRLGYCESQGRWRSGSAVCVLLYGLIRLPSAELVPCPPKKRTSFTSDSLPECQSRPTARLFRPPVKIPRPVITSAPPEGASRSDF